MGLSCYPGTGNLASPIRQATMNQIAALLGDSFSALVCLLPEGHFLLSEAQKTQLWQECLHLVNQGTTRPHELVRVFTEPDALLVS